MKVDQINVECALYDVMDIICKYVNLNDLSNMAKVCNWWRSAALREKANRFYIQQLHFPYEIGNLASMLDVKPYASLLIFDVRLEKSLSLPLGEQHSLLSNGLDEELLENFEKEIPGIIVVLKMDEYLTTEEVEFQGAEEQSNCAILGYFFPKVDKQIHVHVARIQRADDLYVNPDAIHMVVNRLSEELGLNDCQYSKSSLFLLGSIDTCWLAASIAVGLRNRLQNDKEMVFTGIFGQSLVMGNCNGDDNCNGRGRNVQDLVALRISGPKLESWTTFIHFRSQSDEIERKLYELKEKVKRKRYCIGLLYSPKCRMPKCSHTDHPCGNPQEIMRYVKRFFPGIAFLAMFLNSGHWSTDFYLNTSDLMDQNNTFVRGQGDIWFLYVSIIIISSD